MRQGIYSYTHRRTVWETEGRQKKYIHEKLFTASVQYVESLKQVPVDSGWPDFSQQVSVKFGLYIFIYIYLTVF